MVLHLHKYPEREGINVFKVVYRRHTNFAMESIENPFNGAPNFGKKVTCTIQRNGDLIHRMYLQATLPQVQLQPSDGSGAQFRWLNWIGHNLIDYVEIEIGGQRIDKQYGDWLHIWNELTQEPGKQAGYADGRQRPRVDQLAVPGWFHLRQRLLRW